MGKKVLLTGATGLIGQYAIAPLLAAGFEIHAVSRDARRDPAVNWLVGDLLNPADLEKIFAEARPDTLLHLAWETRQGMYLDNVSNFRWLASGLDMLRLFSEYGGKRAVLAGTLSEYADSPEPLRENSPLTDKSLYALCKSAMFALASRLCAANNVSFAWGRVFFPYGRHEQKGRLTASVIEALTTGEPVIVRSGKLLRDYIYAKDVAAGFSALLQSGVEGAINISNGRVVSIEEYCRCFGRLAGREDLLRFEDAAGDQTPVVLGDNRRLREEVGFTPRYDLEAGVAEILGEGKVDKGRRP